ncbi:MULTISPECIES: autotransporter strand-loop-strand O-heptosyltransferase [Paraburkholderia]|uniref:Autotransporter strand-loop-strand O-heptosyltransferase n=1 Tax=Paraburkholderia madseniana TaxID=2599607 RepID=A0AAP5EZD5_9BURK|nr:MULTISPECIES: autotransporter strand-loop-strand O-heptosyltransferase [Paraburkholderia]MCX4151051.1 autotransporter strand-loop-strand O-heptosyltransferase [Paraburkholderia madseniana]MCX4176691.1 autotransporter strand-loop-strand O-heptosyltransferase [Paraburkholderia madseniana]MDN7153983.1 autotransporter strand-loop-strand O-heptosyltransferase [Paraburkholderia sp. WS6]MDQ6412865.1 autotransporter strand-loop-strand O-heptosyltransferase [Paraburkholderia madseniana]MDQ6464682.1 
MTAALNTQTPADLERSVIQEPRLSSVPVQPVQVIKRAFLAPAEVNTQQGPDGIRYDFNDGCRVSVPEGNWRVEMRDSSSDYVLYRMPLNNSGVSTNKKFFVPFGIRVWKDDALVFEHNLSLKGKKVLIQFPVGTLGDLIAWFPYAVRFEQIHGCKLTCSMGAPIIALFKGTYPSIEFRTPEEVNTAEFYATYNIGLFFNDVENRLQPIDFRHAGLHRTAAYILGVDTAEEPPKLDLPDAHRPIPEKYVCIAVNASTQCKYWNYPGGWLEIVRFLKENGYRVICIDKAPTHDVGLMRNQIPHGCEDETGDRPLIERAHWLKHAEFFIGLSSGLAWLAWAAGTPVVMISGFTLPSNEFWTPYRVINYHVCNGCWNDAALMFKHDDFMWCPRKAGTPQQFECTTQITPEQVRQVIRTIPNFGS